MWNQSSIWWAKQAATKKPEIASDKQLSIWQLRKRLYNVWYVQLTNMYMQLVMLQPMNSFQCCPQLANVAFRQQITNVTVICIYTEGSFDERFGDLHHALMQQQCDACVCVSQLAN